VSAYDHLGSTILAPLGIVIAGFFFEEIGGRNTLTIMALTVFCTHDACLYGKRCAYHDEWLDEDSL